MVRVFLLLVAAAAVAGVAIFIWITEPRQTVQDAWFGADATVRLPLTWALDPASSAAKLSTGGVDDPLLLGMEVVSALTARTVPDTTTDVAAKAWRNMMARRNDVGIWDHDAYDSYPDGWYSAMDFASMALAAFALGEASGDGQFIAEGRDLIHQMIRPVREGGTDHETDAAKCWFSEYAWPDMKAADEAYVLNGAMLAMLALETYAALDPRDDALGGALQCHLASIEAIAPEYVTPDGEWGRYMLQPPTPLHTHYLIYEVNEFDALYRLTGRQLYRDLATERRSRFAQHFKVFRRGDLFTFSRLGPPHPTIPDIYGTRLLFRDIFGSVVATADSKDGGAGPGAFFMTGPLPSGAVSYDLLAYSGESQIIIVRHGEFSVADGEPEHLPYDEKPILDLAPDEECYRASPELSDANAGRLILTFEQPLPASKFNLFLLDIETVAGLSWGIGLNTADRELFRYVDTPHDGRNLVPISRFGFSDPGMKDEMVESATIYIYTDAIKGAVPFCLRRILSLENYSQLSFIAQRDGAGLLTLRLD